MNIIEQALKVMESTFEEATERFSSSALVKDYCRLQLGAEAEEVFSVMFLDNHNRLIKFDKIFRGSVNISNVYLRAIVRKIIEYNAAKVIFSHNHPSGCETPSQEDIDITKTFAKFLKEIDCEVLDHIVVTAHKSVSLAEAGLI